MSNINFYLRSILGPCLGHNDNHEEYVVSN
jgi:hypothetical protein